MLNSMNLTNGHYPLKIKSMFDLAIASSQRYSMSPSQHHPPPHNPRHHQHHQHHQQQISYPNVHQGHPHPSSQFTSQSHSHEPQPTHPLKLEQNCNDNNNSGGGGMVEECGAYPRSPNSEIDQKSNDSSGGTGGVSPTSFNNNLGSPEVEIEGRGKQGQGLSSGGKPSFSIESLLAHSSSWRRHQGHAGDGGGNKGIKDSRFLPYHIPPQQQQQGQQGKRSSDSSKPDSAAGSGCPTSDNDKRGENFGAGGNGKPGGNGRRAAKSKRVRTIFTPEQLERLEAEFERQQYMVGPERLYLASSLYLTEAQVKVWFQNRRIKWRKQHLEMEQQRLALYRTLAEQDMIASAGDEEDDDEPEEDSADCDYELEETDCGGRDGDHQRSPHFSAHHRPNINHSFPTVSSHHGHTSLHPPPSKPSKSERIRLPLQQTSSNEDSSSTPTSPPSSTPASKGEVAVVIPTSFKE